MDRERRKNYPANWEHISRQFRESKGFTCEHCGVKQGMERVSRRTGVVYPVLVCAAHVDPSDLANPHAKLKCLCQTCHGKYDYQRKSREEQVAIQRLLHAQLLTRRLAGRRGM